MEHLIITACEVKVSGKGKGKHTLPIMAAVTALAMVVHIAIIWFV